MLIIKLFIVLNLLRKTQSRVLNGSFFELCGSFNKVYKNEPLTLKFLADGAHYRTNMGTTCDVVFKAPEGKHQLAYSIDKKWSQVKENFSANAELTVSTTHLMAETIWLKELRWTKETEAYLKPEPNVLKIRVSFSDPMIKKFPHFNIDFLITTKEKTYSARLAGHIAYSMMIIVAVVGIVAFVCYYAIVKKDLRDTKWDNKSDVKRDDASTRDDTKQELAKTKTGTKHAWAPIEPGHFSKF